MLPLLLEALKNQFPSFYIPYFIFLCPLCTYLFKRRYVTECFIAFIIRSTFFGQLYAHHHELETILVLLLHMACNVLVPGGRQSGAGQQAMRQG
jgi:hypothetical protein